MPRISAQPISLDICSGTALPSMRLSCRLGKAEPVGHQLLRQLPPTVGMGTVRVDDAAHVPGGTRIAPLIGRSEFRQKGWAAGEVHCSVLISAVFASSINRSDSSCC